MQEIFDQWPDNIAGILDYVVSASGEALYCCAREAARPLNKEVFVKNEITLSPADQHRFPTQFVEISLNSAYNRVSGVIPVDGDVLDETKD